MTRFLEFLRKLFGPLVPDAIVKEFRFPRRTVNFMGEQALHNIMTNDLRQRASIAGHDITGWTLMVRWHDPVEPGRQQLDDIITAIVSASPR